MQLTKIISILILSLTVFGGCVSGRTSFNKGQNLEATGDLDQAVIKYAEASTANPEISEYRLRFLKACAEAARLHVVKGDEFAAVKNYGDALREYQTAFTLDPSLERAKQQAGKVNKLVNSQALYKEGEEFEKTRKTREALRSYKKAWELDPANQEAKDGIDRITKNNRSKLEGFELNLKSTKPITLKFKDAKIKEVFNIITKLSGINFIFDEGVKDTNFSIYLENGTFYQALDVITELNKLDKKILNESNVIIYPKNPEKKKQYEELYLQTFYLNKIDAKKAINLLRTMMQIKKIYVNEEMNAIVIRDTPDVIALAGKILEANDIPDAEVILEVEVIELSKKNAENLGFLLSRYAISAQGFNNNTPFVDTLPAATSTPTVSNPANPSNLLQLFQYKQFSGFLTVPNATYNFGKTLSNGETLSNPKMRIKNKEKAKFNVGTRVPITTTSSPTGGGVSVNVQYVDVGVKLNAEPTIQLNNEISIKLSMEVSSILSRDTVGGTGSATTVVTIGTRNLDTVLSLKDGETSIIGGLIQDTKNKSKQKISFIGEIPIIGSIFSSHDDTNDKTELILAITPRIIRSLAIPEPSVAAFWSGKEDEPSTIKNYTSFNQEAEIVPAAAELAVSSPPTGAPAVSKPAGEASAAAPVLTTPDSRRMRRPSAEAAPPAPAAQAQPTVAAPASPQVAVPVIPAPAAAPPAPAAQAVPPLPGAGNLSENKVVLKIAAPKTVKVNDEFKVDVVVSDVTNMYNGMFVLQFNPVLLEFAGAGEGGFLKSDGKPTSFQHTFNRDKGMVNLNLYRIGNVGGASGSGTLAVLTFKALTKGSAKLELSNAYFLAPGGSKPFIADLFSTATEVQ
jgi:general secretion pathway protein D